MTYKTLLVHVEATLESDHRVRRAVEIASDLKSKLIGVGGSIPAYIEQINVIDGPLVQMICDDEAACLKEAHGRFLRFARPLGDASAWIEGEGYPDDMILAQAACADLILASPTQGPRATTIDAGKVTIGAGIPLLTIPPDLVRLRHETILIAWKNTRESRRAVTDALPLLHLAGQVIVVQVKGGRDTDWYGLQAVVARLKEHGVTASAETVERGSRNVADDIVATAERRSADVIVSGAYGHSRLQELSLGGVTRGLLKAAAIPILFSH